MPTKYPMRDSKGRFVKRMPTIVINGVTYTVGTSTAGSTTTISSGTVSNPFNDPPFYTFKTYSRGYIDPAHPANLYQRICLKFHLKRELTWIMWDFSRTMPFFDEWLALTVGILLGHWLTWWGTLAFTAVYFLGALRGHVKWSGRK